MMIHQFIAIDVRLLHDHHHHDHQQYVHVQNDVEVYFLLPNPTKSKLPTATTVHRTYIGVLHLSTIDGSLDRSVFICKYIHQALYKPSTNLRILTP